MFLSTRAVSADSGATRWWIARARSSSDSAVGEVAASAMHRADVVQIRAHVSGIRCRLLMDRQGTFEDTAVPW